MRPLSSFLNPRGNFPPWVRGHIFFDVLSARHEFAYKSPLYAFYDLDSHRENCFRNIYLPQYVQQYFKTGNFIKIFAWRKARVRAGAAGSKLVDLPQ